MSLLTFVLMPAAFYVASPRGVGAVALAWLLMSPITVLPIAWKVFRAIGCSVGSYLNALLPALVGCGAMLAVVAALRAQWPLHGWTGLGAEVSAGGLAYCICLWVLYRSRVMRFVLFFADLRKSRNMAANTP
jgi:hypothetical protein